MKTFLLMAVLVCVVIVANAQSRKSVFHDTDALFKNYNAVTKKIALDGSAQAILKEYYPSNTTIDINKLNEDPFFKDLFDVAAGAAGFTTKKFNSLLSGGPDVTNLANGIADLMIERAKQELTISFFNKLKSYSEKHPEFQLLFPKTADNLVNLLAHSYPQMLPVLRDGFHDDLNMLVQHIPSVFKLPKYQEVLQKFPEAQVLIEVIENLQDIERQKNAAAILNSIASLKTWDNPTGSKNFKNAATAVKLANLVSESMRAETTTWVTSQEITDLFQNTIAVRIYLGLMYLEIQKADLKFYTDSGSTPIFTIIDNQAETIYLVQQKLLDLSTIAEHVEQTVKEISDKVAAHQKPTSEDYYNYINTSLDAIDFLLGVVKTFEPQLTPDQYLLVARKSNNIYKDFYSKNYAAGIADVVDLFDEIKDLMEKENTRKSKDKSFTTPVELKELCSFLERVRPYAVFIGSIVDAKSSGDVKNALDAAILPAGSSSIKKYTRFNFAIQSYVGAFALLSNANKTPNSIWADKFGVTAPIGLSITPGATSWGKGGSLSLFVPLLDIGAIVDHKLKLDSTVNSSTGKNQVSVSNEYQIKLGNIVSPGVFVVYGLFGKLPLSLGVGAQYGPSLSSIDVDNQTVLNKPAWRFNAFLAVDLPFFNIWNRARYR